MKITIIEADRDESAPFRYSGCHDDALTPFPIPHYLDALATYGQPIPKKYRKAARRMLQADLVPDSIGRPGSPPIGIKRDPELAKKILLMMKK